MNFEITMGLPSSIYIRFHERHCSKGVAKLCILNLSSNLCNACHSDAQSRFKLFFVDYASLMLFLLYSVVPHSFIALLMSKIK